MLTGHESFLACSGVIGTLCFLDDLLGTVGTQKFTHPAYHADIVCPTCTLGQRWCILSLDLYVVRTRPETHNSFAMLFSARHCIATARGNVRTRHNAPKDLVSVSPLTRPLPVASASVPLGYEPWAGHATTVHWSFGTGQTMDDKPARTMPRQPDVDEAAPRRETAHDSQTREPAAAAATTDDTLRYHNVDSDKDEEWHLLDLNDEEEEWQLLDLMDDLATERHLDTDESTSDIRVVAGRDTAPPVPQGEKRRPLLDLMAELGMERVVELPSATQTQEAGNGAPGPRVVLWRKRADAGAIDAPTIAQVLARRYPTAPAAWLELRAAHAHDHARARAQSEHGEQLASSVPDSDIPAQERTQQRLEIASPQQDTRGPRIVCWPRLDAIGSTSLANPAAPSSQPDSLSEELNALDIKVHRNDPGRHSAVLALPALVSPGITWFGRDRDRDGDVASAGSTDLAMSDGTPDVSTRMRDMVRAMTDRVEAQQAAARAREEHVHRTAAAFLRRPAPASCPRIVPHGMARTHFAPKAEATDED